MMSNKRLESIGWAFLVLGVSLRFLNPIPGVDLWVLALSAAWWSWGIEWGRTQRR